MTTKRRPRLIRVAIVETTVLGIDAYHASCLECGWRCHRQAHDDGGHRRPVRRSAQQLQGGHQVTLLLRIWPQRPTDWSGQPVYTLPEN